MKNSGISEKDPEFLKVYQTLNAIQQQRLFQAQKNAMSQQLKNKQQNPTTAATNGANGTQTAGPTNSSPTTQTTPSTTSLGPSAIPATAPTNTSAPKGTVQRITQAGSGYFSQEQLAILKNQIFAFKCLSKNQGIPQLVQQSLFAVQQKRLTASVDQIAAAATTSEETQLATNGADSADGDKGAVVLKQHEYTGFKSPRAGLTTKISYSAHKKREMRPMIPSTMPSGVDIEKLRSDREIIVFNRMQARLNELGSLPANIAHVDSRNEDLVQKIP